MKVMRTYQDYDDDDGDDGDGDDDDDSNDKKGDAHPFHLLLDGRHGEGGLCHFR